MSFRLGCFNAALGIIIGAIGGHKKEWPQERKDIFQKALFYQFMNSVGLFASSICIYSKISSTLFISGTLLFSGSLYHRAFTDKQDLSKKFTPFGGMCMIFGWIFLGFFI